MKPIISKTYNEELAEGMYYCIISSNIFTVGSLNETESKITISSKCTCE